MMSSITTVETQDLEQDGFTTRSIRQRITFATEKTMAYVSVLELTSIWERSLRRAKVPLKYSQGFNPRPRLHFAAPLPVGCGSSADLMDIWLEREIAPTEIFSALKNKTPTHLDVVKVSAVALNEPTLAEQLESAEYEVWLENIIMENLTRRIEKLLNSESIPRPRRGRKYRGKTYDLRPLILELQILPESMLGWTKLWMHLKAQPGATGRPDEVLKAMDIIDNLRRYKRSRLILATGKSETGQTH